MPSRRRPSLPKLTEEQEATLAGALTLASLFSTVVEAFGLIHGTHIHSNSKEAQATRLALTKLGIEQGRILIFGDVVGISSPPPDIATSFVPLRAGPTNPDPDLPIAFGTRDLRLDDHDIRMKVEECLNEIVDRPGNMGREEMMGVYGLKTHIGSKGSKGKTNVVSEPALDTNRLEAFREKYELLQDLVSVRSDFGGARRGMSMTIQDWTIKDISKFDRFVKMVREQVDGLINIMDVKEKVDRGMKWDIKALGWHPYLSGPTVRKDWEKLKLIQEAARNDYPEYVPVTETALKYINDELRENNMSHLKLAYSPKPKEAEKRKSSAGIDGLKLPTEKRRSIFSRLTGGFGKSKADKRRNSITSMMSNEEDQDPPRAHSYDVSNQGPQGKLELEPARSKSFSAVEHKMAAMNLDSRLVNMDPKERVAAYDFS